MRALTKIRVHVCTAGVFLVLAGCITSTDNGGNSSSIGSATVTGTINGQSVAPADAISVSASTTSPPGSVGAVAITSQAGLCGRITAGQDSKNTQYLVLVMGDFNAVTGVTATPAAAGTYAVYTGIGSRPVQFAGAVYTQSNASCNVASTSSATAGSVSISSVNGGAFSGSFDLTMNGQDHITGTFTTGNCASLAGVLNQTAQLQCR